MPREAGAQERAHPAPIISIVSVVLMVSSFAPVIKHILRDSNLSPLDLVCIRVLVGFIFLLLISLAWDRNGLWYLTAKDLATLALLGFLGVGVAYAVAAWSLFYTSVTHYVLIYSLTPSFTAALSFSMSGERISALKLTGILLSVVGCIITISEGFHVATLSSFGFGDALVLLFTLMMSAYLVLSAGIVKRYGAITANTIMFGSSFLLLLFGALLLADRLPVRPSLITTSLIVYLGVSTAAVFLLRYLALQFLTPATVGAFHNLVPICSIVAACLFLGEALEPHTIIGGTTILAGVELVRRT